MLKEIASADELTAAVADSTVDTVRLAADIDIIESLTVSRKVTLDLNGKNLHFLSENATGSVIVVPVGGDLTVTDSSATKDNPDGNGKISGGNGSSRPAIDIAMGKYFRHGGGILVDGGTVTVAAGNISDNIAQMGGGVAVMSGAFHMSGGTIQNCTSDSDCNYSGGGIFNCSTGTVVLSGTASILNCNGTSEGGAILNRGKMTIRNAVTVDGCSTRGTYAVIFSNSDELEIVDGEFHGNMRVVGGGFDAVARPKISGGTFYDKLENEGAIISGGTFLVKIRNRGGVISGGLFKEVVDSSGDTGDTTTISGGTFMKTVYAWREDIEGEIYISGGMFYGGIVAVQSIPAEILGHTVVFTVDGKEYARQVVSGDAVTVQPIDPAEKKYYIFDGWYDGETKFTFGGKVDADITLTAGWNEIPAFQLRINEETNEWEYSNDHGETWMSFGVKASAGEKGDKGDTGETGAQGEKGDIGAPGADGKDGNTPYIGDNGNWWIGDTDTGVNATGNKGEKGDKGDTGAQGERGDKGADGQDGKDGNDGVTPILKIGTDNLWYVSYDSGTTWMFLGVKATGEKGDKGDVGTPGADGKDGKDGIGIAKAELNTNGELVLTYTDGNTVNVGRVLGVDGKDGKDASAVKVNADVTAETNIHPAIIVIGAAAGVSLIGNLALLLYLVLRKKNQSM